MVALRLPRWTDAKRGFWLDHFRWILPPHNLSSESVNWRKIPHYTHLPIPAKRFDVKRIESSRNLSAKACSRQLPYNAFRWRSLWRSTSAHLPIHTSHSMRQLANSPIALGALLGAIFGAWDILVTAVDPLADDTPAALFIFYGPMFTAWGLAGFAAARRSGRLTRGGKAGGIVALVTFVVFWIANLARVNLFLNAMGGRADWQNLVVRFQTSGFESLERSSTMFMCLERRSRFLSQLQLVQL
jgi:hypothetical protein